MLVQDEFSAGHGFNVNWNENGNFNLNGNNDKSNVNANNRGVRPVLALSFLNTPFIYGNGGQLFVYGHLLVAPLVGMLIDIAHGVHVAWRSFPV